MADLRSELKRIRDRLKGISAPANGQPAKERTPGVIPPRQPKEPSHLAREPAPPSPALQQRPTHPPQPVRQCAGEHEKAANVASQRPPQPAPPKITPVPIAFRPLPKKALTRQNLFRTPEPWVAAGGKTQCVESDQRGAVDIFIGLDFGTSFTKAAVGFKDKIFPVTWEGTSRCLPEYLLPSEYTEFEDGTLFVGQHCDADAARIRGDLKLPFLDPAVSSASIGTAAAFIGLLLRYIRAWVYHHHATKLGKARIRWQLNIGSPSNGPDDSRLVLAYRLLAATAWQRSIECDVGRLASSPAGVWQEGQPLQDLVDLQVHAEFVAQMAGYMQSPQRQRGLHALVDVGGGTLDLVTFIVHRVEDEDTFPFLVPRVHPLGTHGLLQNRLVDSEPESGIGVIDELAPIASARDFAGIAGISESHVLARDSMYVTKLCRVIKSVFEITRSRRYRLSDAWQTGVRTFFTGGGAGVALYQNAVRTAEVPSARGLQLMPLPLHRNLDGFNGGLDDYQRISVACGLAQDSFTLGRIVPAKEVEDDRAMVLIDATGRPDRDDLYPK